MQRQCSNMAAWVKRKTVVRETQFLKVQRPDRGGCFKQFVDFQIWIVAV